MFENSVKIKKREAAEIISSTGSGAVRMDVPVPEEFQLCHSCEKVHGDYRAISPTPRATQEEFDAWKAYLARWTVNYPAKCIFDPYIDGAGHLRVDLLFPEEKDARNPDQLLDRAKSAGLLVPSNFPDNETPRWLRANLLFHLNHELDEWMKFDDKSVFNPHIEAHHTCEVCIKRWKGIDA